MERGFQWPPLDLAPFLERFWWWRSEAGEVIQMPLLAPGVGAELFVHFRQPFRWRRPGLPDQPGAMTQLMAVRNGPADFAAQGELDFLAVRFRAGALRHFLPCSPGELPEDRVSAEDLWGSAVLTLRERLAEACSPAARVALFCLWLREQRARGWKPDRVVDTAVRALYEEPAAVRMDALAERAGLGQRQFQRRFKAALGISPKRFHGLTRLYRLVRQELLDPAGTYLAPALDLGFFDQAHVIHDFQTLLGTAPQRFLKEARSRTHFYNPSRDL